MTKVFSTLLIFTLWTETGSAQGFSWFVEVCIALGLRSDPQEIPEVPAKKIAKLTQENRKRKLSALRTLNEQIFSHLRAGERGLAVGLTTGSEMRTILTDTGFGIIRANADNKIEVRNHMQLNGALKKLGVIEPLIFSTQMVNLPRAAGAVGDGDCIFTLGQSIVFKEQDGSTKDLSDNKAIQTAQDNRLRQILLTLEKHLDS